ncbi:uncharacterized protein LOC118509811 isoform X2 [Anopheles stephensi]|uniref:uncharacterized protein LOC118509811 isoform X2 n=1 Tax=Anopheles stephensi TaxID=30069 RepID=UPI00165872F8|nr:uncharacterized protein LOC118509811 isoform X2 [Anopheles stephensi]
MMAGRSPAGPGSAMQLLLVRFLLMGVLLLAVLDAEVIAGSVARQTTAASVAEDDDSSSNGSSAVSDELLEDESFEQDTAGGEKHSWPESESTTVQSWTRGEADEDAMHTVGTGTTLGYSAVATTPKIVRPVKQLSRYEQGLEDYDEAADRAEREQQAQQKEQTVEQQYNSMVKPMLTLFNVISTVLSSGRSMRSMAYGEGRERIATDGGNKTEIITFGEKSTSGANGTGGANGEGRYIKGDPLNGYYDFIISEGSYKFWAVFQLVTAAVVIYSTLTAIYYSKVAPLTSDYDYIDYLNGGRSFAGARPIDGAARTGASGRRASGWSWDSLSTSSWFGPAAQAFTIVMDAIERQPK